MRIKNFSLNSDDQVVKKITGEVLRAFHIEIVDSDFDFDDFEIFNDVAGRKVSTRLIVKNNSGTNDTARKFTGSLKKICTRF